MSNNDDVELEESACPPPKQQEDTKKLSIPNGAYGTKKEGIDWDYVQHTFAKVVMTAAYTWYCFYFMLEHRPVGDSIGGGPDNVYPLKDTLAGMTNKVRTYRT